MVSFVFAQSQFDADTVHTAGGDLKMTFIGHATLMFEYNGMVIHIDPVSRYADYSAMPKADIILVTHEHGDHLDPEAIGHIKKDDTVIICTRACADQLGFGTV
ncbi:MAG: MBL fold metallo-hydrolase, partial [Calditrichia bacterium]